MVREKVIYSILFFFIKIVKFQYCCWAISPFLHSWLCFVNICWDLFCLLWSVFWVFFSDSLAFPLVPGGPLAGHSFPYHSLIIIFFTITSFSSLFPPMNFPSRKLYNYVVSFFKNALRFLLNLKFNMETISILLVFNLSVKNQI